MLNLQGIKAVFVAEWPSTQERIAEGRQHNEFWGDYPDIWDEPWGRVHRPFDSRAAMAPFVAHQLLKREGVDYKWLLYGDDDTMWFLSAVVDLLKDYDADLPYFISGAYSKFNFILSLSWANLTSEDSLLWKHSLWWSFEAIFCLSCLHVFSNDVSFFRLSAAQKPLYIRPVQMGQEGNALGMRLLMLTCL